MKYTINIASRKRLGNISEFIIKQVTRHFQTWAMEDPGCSFGFRWVKKQLILETDSLHLLQQWQQSEQQYVDYLLKPVQCLESEGALGSLAGSLAA